MSESFVGDVEFYLAAPDIPAAVEALQAAAPTVDRAYGLNYWGERVLQASDGLEPREALASIFDYCGWEPYFDLDGAITDLALTDLGSADSSVFFTTKPLFDALAAFVRDGSSVQLLSEDGADVVYHFRDGTCTSGAKVDPLDPRSERRAVVSLDLLERIRAYLLASDVAGNGNTGAALAAELEREVHAE